MKAMDRQSVGLFAKWLYENNGFFEQGIDGTSFSLQDASDLVELFLNEYEQKQWKPSGLLAMVLSFDGRQKTSDQYRFIWHEWQSFAEKLKKEGMIPDCLSDELSQDSRSNYLICKQIQDFSMLKGYRYSTRCELVYNFAKIIAEEVKYTP